MVVLKHNFWGMSNWKNETRTNIFGKCILFLISPFISFLFSLRKINTKSSYVIFFLFSVVFGLAFTVSSLNGSIDIVDGGTYRLLFESSIHQSFQDYTYGLRNFLCLSAGYKDYYFDTVAFFVSRISSNYHIMFMVFAIVFAYFSLRSLRYLTSDLNFDSSLSCYILAYMFMMNQIFNINGMRFWTAAWIGVFCLFKIFRDRKRWYYLLVLATPFFHGAFWTYVFIVGLATVVRKYEKIWIVIFVLSFFVSSLSVGLVSDISVYLPPSLMAVADSYTDENHLNLFREVGTGYWWIEHFFNIISNIYINILVFLFIKNSKQVLANAKSHHLYLFLLVWMSFVNFVMPIPSFGVRYVYMSFPLIAYIWLVNFKDFKYKAVLYAMPIFFCFAILKQFRLYTYVLDVNFLYQNVISVISNNWYM